MTTRWRVLCVLFAARAVMAFQFGSVGALGPMVGETFGIDAASVGYLVGLYLSPGVLFALPGGAIGRAFSDRRTVLAGLALMVLGGAIPAMFTSWEAQLGGRVIAGVGGVIVNVLMAKMVTDLFAGREIATAMALFVNCWPAGIGLALLAQPHVAAAGGVGAAFGLTAALSAAAFVGVVAGTRRPAGGAISSGGFPRGAALCGILVAGAIWGVFNAAFTIVFAFGPMLLAERGWSLAAVGQRTRRVRA